MYLEQRLQIGAIIILRQISGRRSGTLPTGGGNTDTNAKRFLSFPGLFPPALLTRTDVKAGRSVPVGGAR